MNKNDAKVIAQTISNEQLKEMFDNAKLHITNWNVVSNCNKGMSKGVAWNILAKDFNVTHNYHILAKINMIREFGEFLPNYLKPTKKTKYKSAYIHQDPKF